jgi:Na+/pantothenate symporter
VAIVLDEFVFSQWGLPFWSTVTISIALIWLYTYRGGIKTVVWTDTLQTLFMLLAAGLAIWSIKEELGWSMGKMIDELGKSNYTQIFNWDASSPLFFWKQFISGAFITIVMTGMDQDMMQKNLTCRTLGDAQKNMTTLSIIIVFVNIGFLILGALLYFYGQESAMAIWNHDKLALWDAGKACFEDVGPGDRIFPFLAMKVLPPSVGFLFILGLIAAAYSSADSALTALTTSVCVDFLGFEKKSDEDAKRKTRIWVHIGVSVGVIITIMIFRWINDASVITAIFKMAGYTYGPLLGMFAFGILTRMKVWDKSMPIAAVSAPVLSYAIETLSGNWFGFSILLVNGAITFLLILILSAMMPEKTP